MPYCMIQSQAFARAVIVLYCIVLLFTAALLAWRCRCCRCVLLLLPPPSLWRSVSASEVMGCVEPCNRQKCREFRIRRVGWMKSGGLEGRAGVGVDTESLGMDVIASTYYVWLTWTPMPFLLLLFCCQVTREKNNEEWFWLGVVRVGFGILALRLRESSRHLFNLGINTKATSFTT